jgi:CRISPR-associated protein Cas1
MAAHGTPPLQWVSTACTPDLLAFGREAFAIRAACGPESRDPGLRDYDARLREHFHCGRNDRLPEARKELAALRDKPLPVASSPSATRLLEAAVKARLLRRGTPGQFLPTCAPERHALEHLANLLEGTWFELYVLDLAQRCPDLVDLHWSVRPKHQELAAFGETDIVGVDTQAIGLRVISCKTSLGGRQPLEHMEALAQRSRDESADPKHLDAGNSLQALAGQAQATDSFDSLRGYEGYGAALYFDRLRRYFPETAPFNGRNRRPPKDAANALLSWTYTIVLTEIDAAVRSAGLDPCLGFLHEISYGRPSLSLDLLEPLRAPLCDMLVLGLLNHRLVRAEEHFETSPEDGGVTLNDRGRRAFFPEYERTMQRRFAESEDAVVAYRICQSCVRQAESMGVVPALGKRVCYIL